MSVRNNRHVSRTNKYKSVNSSRVFDKKSSRTKYDGGKDIIIF